MAMESNHVDPSLGAFASQTHNLVTSSSSESTASGGSEKRQLQAEFQPSDYSVICGRGNDNFNYGGNRRFGMLASIFIES